MGQEKTPPERGFLESGGNSVVIVSGGGSASAPTRVLPRRHERRSRWIRHAGSMATARSRRAATASWSAGGASGGQCRVARTASCTIRRPAPPWRPSRRWSDGAACARTAPSETRSQRADDREGEALADPSALGPVAGALPPEVGGKGPRLLEKARRRGTGVRHGASAAGAAIGALAGSSAPRLERGSHSSHRGRYQFQSPR